MAAYFWAVCATRWSPHALLNDLNRHYQSSVVVNPLTIRAATVTVKGDGDGGGDCTSIRASVASSSASFGRIPAKSGQAQSAARRAAIAAGEVSDLSRRLLRRALGEPIADVPPVVPSVALSPSLQKRLTRDGFALKQILPRERACWDSLRALLETDHSQLGRGRDVSSSSPSCVAREDDSSSSMWPTRRICNATSTKTSRSVTACSSGSFGSPPK